ncbi:MAG TPA: anti-sigma factor [Terriglobales bacterium]|jgi:anti-sigma-K factor RskA|nr:anti-sigma factor [Terriglobales bacterium]
MSAHEQFADDLALYALESLDGEQRQSLEKHLEGCASCRGELELLRGDTSLLALTTSGPKPPARSRRRLLSAIANEPRLPAVASTPVPERRPHSWRPTFGWVAAAAVALVCIALLRQNSNLQHDIVALRTQFSDQGTKLDDANQTVATLMDPDATRIELVATGNKPEPRGKAIYQRRNRNLIFFASNLPALPAEKIYELWLFPANGGAPIPAGLFKPDARGSATVVNPPLPEGVEAKNFAVTLEPASGSHEHPRGTPVIVGVGE